MNTGECPFALIAVRWRAGGIAKIRDEALDAAAAAAEKDFVQWIQLVASWLAHVERRLCG